MFSLIFIGKMIENGKQFLYVDFPLGIDSWESLRRFAQKCPKLLEKVVFAWLPFSGFEARFKVYCFDVVRK